MTAGFSCVFSLLFKINLDGTIFPLLLASISFNKVHAVNEKKKKGSFDGMESKYSLFISKRGTI